MTLEELENEFFLFDVENSWDISTPLEVKKYALAWRGFLRDDILLVRYYNTLLDSSLDSLEKRSILGKEEGLISNYLGYINKVSSVINEVNYREAYKLLSFTLERYSKRDDYGEDIESLNFRKKENSFKAFFRKELEIVSKIKPYEKKKAC